MWPKELREDLRAGIKAQHQGNLLLSARYLQRAWEACLTLPKEDLGSNPWLKVSGIACKLGEVLEDSNQSDKAYDIYAQCCNLMQGEAAASRLSTAERRRAIALSMHLGELAELLGKPERDEEHWLLWNVEEFLRIYKENSGEEALRHLDDPHEQELKLPVWTEKDGFEIALEALARYYAKQGNAEYALSLYLRAISLILPPTTPEARAAVSPARRCRAAQMMTNISGLYIDDSASPERLDQAKSWTVKGMEVVEQARTEIGNPSAKKNWIKKNDANQLEQEKVECERVWAVLLYNLGSILEMQDNQDEARELFKRALRQSRDIGLAEGIAEAENALARMAVTKTTYSPKQAT